MLWHKDVQSDYEKDVEILFEPRRGMYGSLAVAISAILADCYETSRPFSGFLQASTTMRASAMVGVLFLALDEGSQHQKLNTQYRWSRMRIVLASSFLIYITTVSIRTATHATRAWEGVFTYLVLFLSLLFPRFYSYTTSDFWGRIQRVTNPLYTATFAVLAYAGTCIVSSGIFMCRNMLDQINNPEFGFRPSDLIPGDLCIACNGWGAACVVMSGTVLFLTSISCLFILNNPTLCNKGLPDYVLTYGELNQSLRLAISLYSATLVCSYLAVADCLTNTDRIYDHTDCLIGSNHLLTEAESSMINTDNSETPQFLTMSTLLDDESISTVPNSPIATPVATQLRECSPQLIEFRRLGLVQHSLGCNTLSFIALTLVSLRIEQDYVRIRTNRKLSMSHVAYPGMLVASITIVVAIALRINISEWNTDGFIEISFFTVMGGIVIGSFKQGALVASFLVYVGLLIEYVYYCETENGCRNFRYLTNASNANMGILYVLALVLELMCTLDCIHDATKRVLNTALQWTTRLGLSISVILALLVTAALAAYDGSNVDEVVVRLDPIVNAGLGEQQTILRFLLWHYAPLIAWAFFARAVDEVGLFEKEKLHIRLLLWVLGGALAGGSWFLYGFVYPNNSETPAAYPMSQMVMMIFAVVPTWILVAY